MRQRQKKEIEKRIICKLLQVYHLELLLFLRLLFLNVFSFLCAFSLSYVFLYFHHHFSHRRIATFHDVTHNYGENRKRRKKFTAKVA